MVRRVLDWHDELEDWLEPFLTRLGHKAQRRMCPLYIAGLIGPGDRKSVQPMAERLVPVTMTSCTISLLLACGMPHRWRPSCSCRRTGWSVAPTRCW